MNIIKISVFAGAMLMATAAVALAADQAAMADQTTTSPSAGMTAQSTQAALDPTMVVAGDAGTKPSQIDALREGDNRVVTNGPIPDTPANRARFGKPLSHAGKKTAPSGN